MVDINVCERKFVIPEGINKIKNRTKVINLNGALILNYTKWLKYQRRKHQTGLHIATTPMSSR